MASKVKSSYTLKSYVTSAKDRAAPPHSLQAMQNIRYKNFPTFQNTSLTSHRSRLTLNSICKTP